MIADLLTTQIPRQNNEELGNNPIKEKKEQN
jgi:hypothetical protein